MLISFVVDLWLVWLAIYRPEHAPLALLWFGVVAALLNAIGVAIKLHEAKS